MNHIGYIEVGKIITSQGIQGDLIVKLRMEIDPGIQQVYLDLLEDSQNTENNKIPYDIENFSLIDDKTALIKFREVSGRSQTSFLEGKNIYIKEEDHYFDFAGTDTQSKLTGYKIFDHQEKKHLGKIIGLKKFKNKYVDRTLMFVEYENQALPVPYEENIIRYIDHNEKKVYINLPDEFLEVLLTNQ